MKLPATDLRAAYRVIHPFRLPHHSGSMLRGILGRALRAAACTLLPERLCLAECQRPTACSYTSLFDPPVPDPLPHRLLHGSTRAPQPLIPLFPPPGSAELTLGHTLTLGLRVLGPFHGAPAEHLRTALEAFTTFPIGAAKEGRLELHEIGQRGPRQRVLEIAAGAPGPGTLRIETETPLWLAEGKKKLAAPEALDFSSLFRHAYRRLTLLTALYGEWSPADDALFQQLLPLAAKVETVEQRLRPLHWERSSDEKGEKQPMMGLMGSLAFTGEVGVFAPFFQALELTHLGKSVSHGLGRVRVQIELRP